MDESRKAFEQWIANTTNSDLHRSIMLDRRESGAYIHLATENKWEAWQASREALEVKLPEVCAFNLCELLDKKEVIEAIRDAGIKVKE